MNNHLFEKYISHLGIKKNNPTLKFTITPPALSQCSSANPLACMGQSWSKPTLTWINWKGTKKLVMLVGGGYDAEGLPTSITIMPETTAAERAAKQAKIKYYRGYEYNDYAQTNKIGSGVYMFDALDGSLLWWASANATVHTSPTTAIEIKNHKLLTLHFSFVIMYILYKYLDNKADIVKDTLCVTKYKPANNLKRKTNKIKSM